MQSIDVILKGVGGGRDSSIRSLVNQGFTVNSIKDVTPVPHNGPRPPKVRRV
jgi:small subunit ribosomal protein S11